ncbi:MAG: class I SAM-dependent methyltransferase [Candidatus Omnitrophica bacterium]|nr:class I SAM-dependent methyltransferase [Candidatus Omnitrophota bacterium]
MIGLLRKILPEAIPAWAAVSYSTGAAKLYGPQYKFMAGEIAAVARGVLLDIGTGPGLVPLEIGKIAPSLEILGIDVSEAMIAIAQKKREELGQKQVSFRVMNGDALAFADNSFDMIISTDALHHFKRPVMVFDEIYRCLKPGGEAWVYDGFPEASDKDIAAYIHGAGGVFLPYWFLRLNLLIHGFSKKEYDNTVRYRVSQSRFGTCIFEQRGIMMRLRFCKR